MRPAGTGDPTAFGFPAGLLARSITHDLRGFPLTYLMAADRHHHYKHVIRPTVNAGTVVVCDRYVATALVLDQIDGADPDFVRAAVNSMSNNSGHRARMVP